MTVKELVTRFIERNHFAISRRDHHKDNQYDFDQTFFTVGDYEAIENSAMENAETITPIYDIDEVPADIAEMEVSEFVTYEDTVLLIFIYI